MVIQSTEIGIKTNVNQLRTVHDILCALCMSFPSPGGGALGEGQKSEGLCWRLYIHLGYRMH